MANLHSTHYLSFPFAIAADGPKTSDRAAHVREQIEQVLFTSPGERVFRPEFGVGIRRLVFEPNSVALSSILQKQLISSLTVALQGEVDPKTLDVDITQSEGKLIVLIRYQLAAINLRESISFNLGEGIGG